VLIITQWKLRVPVFKILEDYFDITLTNAQQIKIIEVRCDRKKFCPFCDVRELCDLTRIRKKWAGHLMSKKKRIQKEAVRISSLLW
jgi:transposase